MADVAWLVASERLPNSLHLAADSCELRQCGVDEGAVLIELLEAGLGDLVKLLAALGFDRRVADLFEVGQRWIDHARARRIEALGGFFERLDDLVAMPRTLLEQSQDDKLQFAGAQL